MGVTAETRARSKSENILCPRSHSAKQRVKQSRTLPDVYVRISHFSPRELEALAPERIVSLTSITVECTSEMFSERLLRFRVV